MQSPGGGGSQAYLPTALAHRGAGNLMEASAGLPKTFFQSKLLLQTTSSFQLQNGKWFVTTILTKRETWETQQRLSLGSLQPADQHNWTVGLGRHLLSKQWRNPGDQVTFKVRKNLFGVPLPGRTLKTPGLDFFVFFYFNYDCCS